MGKCIVITQYMQTKKINSNLCFQSVCLSQKFGNDCVSNICNRVYTRILKDCRVQFDYQTNGNQVNFTANSPLVQWDFGDGNFGFGQQVNHNYTSQGVYRVCATLTGNCDAKFCKDIITGNPTNCGAGYSYTISDSLYSFATPPKLNASCLIIYTDIEGIQYSNFKLGRVPNSNEYIELQALENYKISPNGLASIKANLSAEVWLFNSSNLSDSILLKSKNWVMAMPL